MSDELADASAEDALLTAHDGDAGVSEDDSHDVPQGADDIEFEDDEEDEDGDA